LAKKPLHETLVAKHAATHSVATPEDVTILKGTSKKTQDAINAAYSILGGNDIVPPRIVMVGDDRNQDVPGKSRGVMITVNPEKQGQLVENNKEMMKRWGKHLVVDPSMEGVLLHEMTHSIVSEFNDHSRQEFLKQAKKIQSGCGKWLSARAEDDADEFMAELGVAFLRNKPIPPDAADLIKRVLFSPRKK
jgi:hypothetical protein